MNIIEIVILGEPMPKQSVKQHWVQSTEKFVFYVPTKLANRKKVMQAVIRSQLGAGFKPIEVPVSITKMHFIFSPPKNFSKKTLKKIADGEIIYKFTRPDLPDNLKKLVLDCLSGLVFKDDGLIVSEDNVKKYYGLQPQTIIEICYGHIDDKGCGLSGI